MSRLLKILILFAFVFVPSLVASCTCDENGPNPMTTTSTTTGITGSGGLGGSAGHGGAGGSGASTAVGPWGNGPGRPGTVFSLVRDIPLVQGMSSQNQLRTRGATNKCTGEGGSAGGSVGGMGGFGGSSPVGGAGGSGGAGELPWCPTDYTPLQPTLDLSGIDQTSIQLAFTTTPIFQPFDNYVSCDTARQPIEFGRVFIGDCTGVLTEIPAFGEEDLGTFFGSSDLIFQITTKIEVDGHLVSILAGLAVKSAICGDSLFVVSNGSSKIVQIDLAPDAGFARTDHEVSEPGLSGLLCAENGRVLFSTSRIFTAASWEVALSNEDMSYLVEDQPVRIYEYDSSLDSMSLFAEFSGSSRFMATSGVPVDMSGNLAVTMYMNGTANVLTRAADGDILFGDHLDGMIWKVSPDGLTRNLVVSTGRAFTGVVQAPNGVIYLALNASTTLECHLDSKVEIAVFDAQNDTVEDWMTLDDSSYDLLIPQLCNSTSVMEYDFVQGVMYLGGGNFNELAVDLQGNLYVTETILNRTTAIHVVFDEPDGGVGGSGGTSGAGGTTGTGGSTAGAGGT